MLQSFKNFALQGNVLDLAVAVVIGAAFGNMVSSLVSDIITPLIGILIGGVDFSVLMFEVGSAEVMYGKFIQSIFDFIIIAFSIFMVVRGMLKFQSKKKEKVIITGPAVDAKEGLLEEIRDLLKHRKI